MHGVKETTLVPRTVTAIVHLGLVGLVAWLYFGSGLETLADWFNQDWTLGNATRRSVLFGFSCILWLRITLTGFWLLKRKFGWEEVSGVLMALIAYQLVFALLAVTETRGIDLLDGVAMGLFLGGSYLNTGSEVQRKHFKENPANQGRLYTQGWFRYARHINYFGDVLWVTGWALATRSPWALLIPLMLIALFVFVFIPSLSSYLAQRYGAQYDTWAKSTKRLVPYLY